MKGAYVMLICFNGIDGSGKSSQAHALVTRLTAAGHSAVYIWSGSRTPLTRPFTRLAKKFLRRKPDRTTAPADQSAAPPASGSYLPATRRLMRFPLARRAWLHFSVGEHALKIWFTVFPHLLRGRIVVCDRYLYDTAITAAMLSGTGPAELATFLRSAARWKVPAPDQWYFLDLPPEVALARKAPDSHELPLLEQRAPLYRTAAAVLGMTVIDASGSESEVADRIFRQFQQDRAPAPEPHPPSGSPC